MKRLLYILIALLPTLLWAEDVSFRAEAPSQVVNGKPFQLRYTVNQRARDLKAPEFADFDFLAGPYTSTSSSTSFVNGKRTSSYTQTYTYTLAGNKAGTYTIPPATIRVDGDDYTSSTPTTREQHVLIRQFQRADGIGFLRQREHLYPHHRQ